MRLRRVVVILAAGTLLSCGQQEVPDDPASETDGPASDTEESLSDTETSGETTSRDVDDTSGCVFADADFADAGTPGADEIVLVDRFGRVLNEYGVNLVDWQGYLANPYVPLTLSGPEVATYPVDVVVTALGTSRLMLDYPSTLTASGAVKELTLDSADDAVTFLVEIHPDRDGGPLEEHVLAIEATDASGLTTSLSVPLRVLDQDEDEPGTPFPVHIDTRYDDLDSVTNWFSDEDFLAAATYAIEDWFYFFDMEPFDEVGAGEETLWLTGDDWTDHEAATNDESFTGMWVFVRSFSSPYSTGYPANNGSYHTRDGEELEGPIHRSVALIWEGDHSEELYFTSMDDEQWYLSDPYSVLDVYTFVMHEFGHSIAYHSLWGGMAEYIETDGLEASEVIAYQGEAAPLDGSGHLTADHDRISGQNGGWSHLFPVRRWMITKLSLLVASEAGWELDRSLTPFLEPTIRTDELPEADSGHSYRYCLAAEGGVPFYDWTVVDGELPAGFSVNRYTGVLQSDGAVDAPAGTYRFTVQLEDHDELAVPAERRFELEIR